MNFLLIYLILINVDICHSHRPNCDADHFELSFGCPKSSGGYIIGIGPHTEDLYAIEGAAVTTLSQCLQICSDNQWCKRTAWHPDNGICKVYNNINYGNEEAGCMQALKICKRIEDGSLDETYVEYGMIQRNGQIDHPAGSETYNIGNYKEDEDLMIEQLYPVNPGDTENNKKDVMDNTEQSELSTSSNQLYSIFDYYKYIFGNEYESHSGAEQSITRNNSNELSPTEAPHIMTGDFSDACNPYELVSQTRVDNGNLLEYMMHVDLCKYICSHDSECLAVTFNKETRQCTVHDSLEPNNLNRGQNPCCNFYRKTDCYEKQCFDGNGTDIADWELVDCSGICYVDDYNDEDGNRLSMRGCDHSQLSLEGTHCFSEPELDNNGDIVSSHKICLCVGNGCNRLPVRLFEKMYLYLDLDRNTKDQSISNMHGQSHNLQYDDIDSVSGSSAYFSGTAYILIYGIAGIPVLLPTGSHSFTNFTLTFWFKSQVIDAHSEGSKMYIAGNDMMEIATYIHKLQNKQYVEFMLMSKDRRKYIVYSDLMPVNEWINIAITICKADMNSDTQVNMTLYYDIGTPETKSFAMQGAPSISSVPLYIGRSWKNEDYFHGFVDMFYMFHQKLDEQELMQLWNRTEGLLHSTDDSDLGSGEA